MENYEIEAAWRYHNGTKHPYGALLNRSHSYNPASRPIPYKRYADAQKVVLALDKGPRQFSTIDAISENFQASTSKNLPDISILSKILYFSGGITKTLNFGPSLGDVDFRAASCTGALYHIEIYLICSGVPGLAAGVYHYDPRQNTLDVLRRGDYRKVVAEATAHEPSVAHSPAILVLSDVFSRNAVKYQAREYRHAFWDSGTITSNLLAMAASYTIPHKLILGFWDDKINALLGLDGKEEAAIAIVSLGYMPAESPAPPADERVPSHEQVQTFPPPDAINEMHQSSSLVGPRQVEEWRGNAFTGAEHAFATGAGKISAMTPLGLEETIMRRGSTRKFSHESISLDDLIVILGSSSHGLDSDFETKMSINDIYLIANAVSGLEQGSYFYNRASNSLNLLRSGDYRDASGHLGLDQSLAYDAAVDIFFMSDLGHILKRLGNRGYRAAQMDAAVSAGRVYLAAYAMNIGATGLTFYDDEVIGFFSPHGEKKDVMFMVALGRKARRKL